MKSALNLNQGFSRPYFMADNQLAELREWTGELVVWIRSPYLVISLLVMLFGLAMLIRKADT
ncbi:hypothetical protein [Spirosoma sp. 209]|uniref:hypothetical protein n=1 Tax=Spirosoma sp. 209 TaxID=1955701 RepID=UPI0011162DC0|nr:hypothetical protein [Spirosoma sp. 209]